jgi:hypothetical protein
MGQRWMRNVLFLSVCIVTEQSSGSVDQSVKGAVPLTMYDSDDHAAIFKPYGL